MAANKIDLKSVQINPGGKNVLFDNGRHAVYWLGMESKSAFRCNVYLIVNGDEGVILDPGGPGTFPAIRERVSQIIDCSKVTAMVLSHQDPDVAASMVDWLELNPNMKVMTSPRTRVLINHYGKADYQYVNTEDNPQYTFKSGDKLTFIDAPFLHFPGAITTYDESSKFLFSGDIWAALSMDWNISVSDFEEHIPRMNLFHLDYMCSNVATRGYANRIENHEISAILPQHGSIIGSEFVGEAKRYLKEIQCGLDLIYV